MTAGIRRQWVSRIGTAAVGAALIFGLSSCRFDHHLADSTVTGNPQVTTANPAAPAAPVTGGDHSTAGAAAPGGPAAAPPSAIARINSDLSGIDAGNSQAGGDLSAGDSDQSQPDTP